MFRKTSFIAGFLSIAVFPAMAFAQTVQDVPPAVESQPVDPAPDAPTLTPAPVVTPAPAPAPAPAKPPVTSPKKKGPVDSLKPGQYVWEARASKATDLRIVAVLDIQRIYVFDGGTLVGFSTMSSGKKGHATPTGSFKILQKNVDHFSNIYDNAPMPFMQRLTWDGIALHAGKIPGYPASHGCIRLPMPFAKSLYGITKMDQTVIILPSLDAPKAEPKPEPKVEPVPDQPPAGPTQPSATPVEPAVPPSTPA